MPDVTLIDVTFFDSTFADSGIRDVKGDDVMFVGTSRDDVAWLWRGATFCGDSKGTNDGHLRIRCFGKILARTEWIQVVFVDIGGLEGQWRNI